MSATCCQLQASDAAPSPPSTPATTPGGSAPPPPCGCQPGGKGMGMPPGCCCCCCAPAVPAFLRGRTCSRGQEHGPTGQSSDAQLAGGADWTSPRRPRWFAALPTQAALCSRTHHVPAPSIACGGPTQHEGLIWRLMAAPSQASPRDCWHAPHPSPPTLPWLPLKIWKTSMHSGEVRGMRRSKVSTQRRLLAKTDGGWRQRRLPRAAGGGGGPALKRGSCWFVDPLSGGLQRLPHSSSRGGLGLGLAALTLPRRVRGSPLPMSTVTRSSKLLLLLLRAGRSKRAASRPTMPPPLLLAPAPLPTLDDIAASHWDEAIASWRCMGGG